MPVVRVANKCRMFVALAIMGAFAAATFSSAAFAPPASAQGLVGMPPAHPPRPPKEWYRQQASDAESNLRAWDAIRSSAFGEVLAFLDDDIGERLLNEALDWVEADEYAKAELCFRKAIAIKKDPERLPTFYYFYAEFLEDQKRYGEALQVQEQAVQRDEQSWGKHDPRLCVDLKRLGGAYCMRAFEQAETGNKEAAAQYFAKETACYRRALDIWIGTRNFTFDWIMTGEELAECLARQGRNREAEAVWKQLLQLQLDHEPGNFWHLSQIYQGATLFYVQSGQNDKAAPLCEKLLALCGGNKRIDPSETHFAVNALEVYARILKDNHRDAKAKQVLALVSSLERKR